MRVPPRHPRTKPRPSGPAAAVGAPVVRGVQQSGGVGLLRTAGEIVVQLGAEREG